MTPVGGPGLEPLPIQDAQQRVIQDGPMDPSGTRLVTEPNDSAPMMIPGPVTETPRAPSSRRSSATATVNKPKFVVKRQKTISSAASSRRSSLGALSEVPGEMLTPLSRQATPGVDALPPVPEDEPVDDEQVQVEPGATDVQLEDKTPGSASLLMYEMYTINSKAFCLQCGSVDKHVESGRTQCSRCLSFEFTDHPDQVENWFDEDVEYDARLSRWQPSLHARADELHVPNQTELELDEIWTTGSWNNNEIHRAMMMSASSSTTRSPLRSMAVWMAKRAAWTWITLANVDTDCELEEQPEKCITIYHSCQKKKNMREEIDDIRHHRALYGNNVPETVLLLRHGRSGALRRGWDGTPMEFQSLCSTPDQLHDGVQLS